MNGQSCRRRGFTLLEVMAVVALIGVVFFIALNFYTDLNTASTRASENTRGVRRASAILDRIARDIEGAMLLVKPDDMDPFSFPWIFLGETRLGGSSSERLKFITRNHNPTQTDAAESNLATVAYVVESSLDDSVELYRWTSPHLPESLDKEFPRGDDEGSFLLAEGLREFGFTFLGEDGELRNEWDSSTILDSGSLPIAVDIQLSLMDDTTSEDGEPPVYRRRVLIPVRPLDLVALADPNDPIFGSDDDEDSEDGDGDGDGDGKDDKPGKKKGNRPKYTHADCFPKTAPADAPMWAQMCIGLANSAPTMEFRPEDYAGAPDECKPYIDPKCR